MLDIAANTLGSVTDIELRLREVSKELGGIANLIEVAQALGEIEGSKERLGLVAGQIAVQTEYVRGQLYVEPEEAPDGEEEPTGGTEDKIEPDVELAESNGQDEPAGGKEEPPGGDDGLDTGEPDSSIDVVGSNGQRGHAQTGDVTHASEPEEGMSICITMGTKVRERKRRGEKQTGTIEDFPDRYRPVIEMLFNNPGVKFRPSELKELLEGYKNLDTRSQTFVYLINALKEHPLGAGLRSEGNARNRRYWIEADGATEPSHETSQLGTAETPGTEVDKAETTGIEVDKAETPKTEADKLEPIQLTAWGLTLSADGTKININGQELCLGSIATETVKTLVALRESVRFEDLQKILTEQGHEIDSEILKGVLHEIRNKITKYAPEDKWYDRDQRTNDGLTRLIKITGILEGALSDFLAQKRRQKVRV